MAQVKKLSVAKVFGKVLLADLMQPDPANPGKVIPRTDPMLVMRCGGLATGTKTGASDYGDWTALQGDFVAYSAKDGAEHRAPYLFLPDVALVPIEVALAQASTTGVRFLIDLFVQPDAASTVGYVYTFVPVVKPAGEDPIQAILSAAAPLQIGGKAVGGTLALPSPDPTPSGSDPAPAPAGKASKGARK